MDLSAILPSIITGAVTALGTILGFITATKENKQKAKQAHDKALADFQANIESKLDAHKVEYMGEIAKVNNAVKQTNENMTDLRAQTQQFQAVMEERIETLSSRVERHNNVIERTFHLEERASVLEEKVRVANHRIEDLERSHE
jgi:uncharacterized protein YwgA